ncbi:hypothetical protein GGF31_005326 [Allomyces arbusculus]|nr:hypothetical protein GGF31_005326 [Allomyces arbusculus]
MTGTKTANAVTTTAPHVADPAVHKPGSADVKPTAIDASVSGAIADHLRPNDADAATTQDPLKFSVSAGVTAAEPSKTTRPVAELDGVPLPTLPMPEKPRAYLLFDIDSTLYSDHTGVGKRMHELIVKYMHEVVGLPVDEADRLGKQYYKELGLAIRGLVKYHHVDPADYDKHVDQAVEHDKLIHRDDKLRAALARAKPDVVRWTFTNAGLVHAARCLRRLEVEEFFHGMTYCDYTIPNFACKPETPFFEQVLSDLHASAHPDTPIYFADDSLLNLGAAKKLGWHTIWVDAKREGLSDEERAALPPAPEFVDHAIGAIAEIAGVLPDLFYAGSRAGSTRSRSSSVSGKVSKRRPGVLSKIAAFMASCTTGSAGRAVRDDAHKAKAPEKPAVEPAVVEPVKTVEAVAA